LISKVNYFTLYLDPTEQLVTEIFVRDIERSKDFYCGLGFEVRVDRGTFVGLRWETNRLLLDERKDQPPPPGFPPANIRVMVPNVDDIWRLAGEIGARVVNPIDDRRYGLRDFTIADPDGFGVRFGTRLSPS